MTSILFELKHSHVNSVDKSFLFVDVMFEMNMDDPPNHPEQTCSSVDDTVIRMLSTTCFLPYVIVTLIYELCIPEAAIIPFCLPLTIEAV